mgnify:CR=1 FL=1
MLRIGKVTAIDTRGVYVNVPDSGGTMGPLFSFVPFTSLAVGDQVFVAEYSLTDENYVVASKVMAGNIGSLTLPYVGVTEAYTITDADYFIECTANTFTVTLPTAASIAGRQYVVRNSGAGVVTVDGHLTETINGAADQTISAGSALTLMSNGTNWVTV